MKIGIIGSSLSGLIAGKKLAQAGHDVTLFEQKKTLGSKLATKTTEKGFFDYGISSISPQTQEFKLFAEELKLNGVIDTWAKHFKYYDGAVLYESNPNEDTNDNLYCFSKKGINNIVNYLKRWVDVEAGVRVGGLTYIGDNRRAKRAWMINQTNIHTFACDAVIVAADAVNANAILQTTQNKTTARRVSRFIDEIDYYPCFSLMVRVDEKAPVWKGIKALESDIEWIGNESSKSENKEETLLTIQSSGAFAEKYEAYDKQEIITLMLEKTSEILNETIAPVESELHFWTFYEPKKVLSDYFMEVEIDGAPFALTGDYFNEYSLDSAFLSGSYLADYWISKFGEEKEKNVSTDAKKFLAAEEYH